MARDKLSVKQCLVVIALLCAPVILLGAYTLTFTDSISAESVKVGQPIVVRGRYPGWCGKEYWIFAHKECSLYATEDEEAVEAEACLATRGWLGYHRFETTLDPVDEPGEYSVSFLYSNPRSGGGIPTTTIIVSP